MIIKQHFYKITIKFLSGDAWEIGLPQLSITPLVLLQYLRNNSSDIASVIDRWDLEDLFKMLPLKVCPHCYLRNKCHKYVEISTSSLAYIKIVKRGIVSGTCLDPLLSLDRQGVNEGDTLFLMPDFPYCSQSYEYYLNYLGRNDVARRWATYKIKLLDMDVFEIYVAPEIYSPSYLINRLKNDGIIHDSLLLNDIKNHSKSQFCVKLKSGRVIPAETDVPYSELGFIDGDIIEIVISDHWDKV